jgi:hypothetical protein
MICLIIGYIEAVLKIREIEQNNYSEANPFLNEIKTKLNDIETKLTVNLTTPIKKGYKVK